MTQEEIKEKIAEFERKAGNKSMPESAQKAFQAKADALKAELKEETPAPAAKPAAAEKPAEKKEVKAPVKPAAKPASKPAAKAAPVKDKDKPATSGKGATGFTFKGENVSKEAIEYCEQLLASWRARKEKSKASGGTKKTTPVVTKVAAKVVQAATDAIKSIPTTTMKKNPQASMDKIEALEVSTEKFLKSLKDVLADRYDAAKIDKELKPLEDFIKKLKEKYLAD